MLFQSETQIKTVFQTHVRKDIWTLSHLSFSRSHLINIHEKSWSKETSPDNRGPDNRGWNVSSYYFFSKFSVKVTNTFCAFWQIFRMLLDRHMGLKSILLQLVWCWASKMPRLLKKGFQKILKIKILKEMFFQSVTQGAQKEKIWVLPTGVVSSPGALPETLVVR